MNMAEAASGYAAMGSESRLEVVRTLVKAGESGLLVGDIQQRTGIPASTLAHHLKMLHAAGLILQIKDGRTVVNQANYKQLTSLANFIITECCADQVKLSAKSQTRAAR